MPVLCFSNGQSDSQLKSNIGNNRINIYCQKHKQTAYRRNGTAPLFDVLPFEINNENYFLSIEKKSKWKFPVNRTPSTIKLHEMLYYSFYGFAQRKLFM